MKPILVLHPRQRDRIRRVLGAVPEHVVAERLKEVPAVTQSIWKFPIAIADEQEVELPLGAKILCAKAQNDVLCLWAIVEKSEPRRAKLRVSIRGTGHPLGGNEGDYFGTVMTHGDGLVWHVFLKKAAP